MLFLQDEVIEAKNKKCRDSMKEGKDIFNLILTILCILYGVYSTMQNTLSTGILLIVLGILNIPFVVKWVKNKKRK